MNEADEAFVFFNPKTIEHKRLEPITKEEVADAFNKNGLKVYTDPTELFGLLSEQNWENKNLLIMTSGNFSGQNLKEIATEITGNPVQFQNRDKWVQRPDGATSSNKRVSEKSNKNILYCHFVNLD